MTSAVDQDIDAAPAVRRQINETLEIVAL